MTRRLDYRNGLLEAYSDVYTPDALDALEALAPFNRDRRELMARRIALRHSRELERQRISFLDPATLIPRTSIRVQDARDGKFDGSEIPADLKRQWIRAPDPPPGRDATRREQHCATSLMRCFRAPTAGCSTVRTRSGRSRRCPSTTSATSSSRFAAIRVFLSVAEASRRGDESVGAGLFRPPDHRRLAQAARLHHEDLPRARPAPRRPSRPRQRTARASQPRSSMSRSTSSTTTSVCATPAASIVLYLPKIQTAEEAALWNDILAALEQHLGLPDGRDQGLRAGRADRSVLSADGDPRRARHALRRLQHRPLGLHQQRVRRDGLGSRSSSIRTSTRSR